MLKHPDTPKPFVVQVDASHVAVGAVLLETIEVRDLQACARTSCKLNYTERKWAIGEKDGLAVRWALMTWRHPLEGGGGYHLRSGWTIKI